MDRSKPWFATLQAMAGKREERGQAAAGGRRPCEAPKDVPAASRVRFPGRAPAEAASSATPSFGRKRPRPGRRPRAGYMQAMAAAAVIRSAAGRVQPPPPAPRECCATLQCNPAKAKEA